MNLARVERVKANGDVQTLHGQPRAQTIAVLRCMMDVTPRSLRWLWPGRIPLGKLTLLIGDPGLGKSLATVDIAARVSRGTSFPDGTVCERGSTVFLSAEDDAADTIRPRLDSAGADVSCIHVLDSVRVPLNDGEITEKGFSLETDVALLESALAQLPDARLIVVDPLSAYLGGTDSHSNAEIRGLLSPLAAMAARREVAVLAVTHLRKSPGAAVHRAIGSIAFAAAARAVWAVASDPADTGRRLLLAVKQNLSAPAAGLAFRVEALDGIARLTWEPDAVSLSANDVLGEGADLRDSSALAEAREWLADVLAVGPLPATEIQRRANNADLAWRTIRRAADALSIVKRKQSFGGGWEWLLSEDVRSSLSNMDTFEGRSENEAFSGGSQGQDVQGSRQDTFSAGDGEVRL